MRRVAISLLPLVSLTLAACGADERSGSYIGGRVAIECAPFASALTGVRLTDAAADWWSEAGGRYARTRIPAVGSILVFRPSDRLPHGHVAVVSQVVARRQVLVAQANWVHHRVTEDQLVVDISDAGDWSMVRVWWLPSGRLGIRSYPTFGFIQPPAQPQHHCQGHPSGDPDCPGGLVILVISTDRVTYAGRIDW